MKRDDSSTSFLDLIFLLCLVFMCAAQVEQKESSASDRYAPKIHIFIEQVSGGHATKCNGRYINNNQLSKIVKMALDEEVHHVEVIAMIEANVPYGFIDNVKRAALASGVVTKNNQQQLKVVWDSRILSNFSSN